MNQSWRAADYSVARTYRTLRYLAAAALIGMPLLTALSSGLPLEQSLSAYYFAKLDGGLPRTLFVMFLSFLGGVLLAYRGLTPIDNLIHNAAGVFALAVSVFPMKCSNAHCVPGLGPTWIHGAAAGLLFLSALASVLYSGGAPLRAKLNSLGDRVKWMGRLRSIQFLSTGLMFVGVGAFLYGSLAKLDTPYVFWVEYLGFFGFGVYWIRLMWLINEANKAASDRPVDSSEIITEAGNDSRESAGPVLSGPQARLP